MGGTCGAAIGRAGRRGTVGGERIPRRAAPRYFVSDSRHVRVVVRGSRCATRSPSDLSSSPPLVVVCASPGELRRLSRERPVFCPAAVTLCRYVDAEILLGGDAIAIRRFDRFPWNWLIADAGSVAGRSISRCGNRASGAILLV